MSKIIVGVDESQGSNDAIALASGLAGITGSTLMLVNVFPLREPPSPAVNPDFEGYLRQDSQELLERLRNAHGDGTVEVRAIPNPSPAHGLYELAEKENAGRSYDGSTSAIRALEAAGRLAAATAARLSVIRAFEPLAYEIPPESAAMSELASYNDSLRERASEELDAAVAKIKSEYCTPSWSAASPGAWCARRPAP